MSDGETSQPEPRPEGATAQTLRPGLDSTLQATPGQRAPGVPPAVVEQAFQSAPPERAGVQTALHTLPGYEILGELGRGGMGVVYKARQLSLNRIVALKMILAGPHSDPQLISRFRVEAEAIARINHPNIVQIYEIGEHNGAPFFSLELLEGGSLSKRLDATPQPARWCAEICEKLARAVHAAHQQGIIHRDLKPANVLLTACPAPPGRGAGGEGATRSADDPMARSPEPKITDFGLAKRIESAGGVTVTGQVMGTPSYMAPEQAEGNSRLIGPKSDVYSLGAILYEMLTGRAPFKGATHLETLHQVKHDEPVAPRRLQPGIPRDIETICLKCLQKDPAKRYASAEALADDLNAWLSGDSISARPPTVPERIIKRVRKNPSLYAVSIVALAVLVLGTVAFMLSLDQKRRARDEARAAEGRAQNEKDNALAAQKAEARQRESAEAARRGAELEVYRSGIREADRLSSEGK
ncbi:MAG: serine/threonine-protein kinase, partial [Planctomycetota bacterium]|nr:serine/threonine-protein kinase [Planctomycetota bacterium]